MTSLCYLCDVPLLTERDKCACPACGTSYPYVPLEKRCIRCGGPANVGEYTVVYSMPSGRKVAEYCDRCGPNVPANLLPAVEPVCSASAVTPQRVFSSPLAGTFYTQSAPLAGRADAAPGRFTSPASLARHLFTGD